MVSIEIVRPLVMSHVPPPVKITPASTGGVVPESVGVVVPESVGVVDPLSVVCG
jgi:hypothetical protein